MKPVNPISIRIPEDLKQWLEERSIRNFRPLSKELVAILDALRKGEEDDPDGFHRFTSRGAFDA